MSIIVYAGSGNYSLYHGENSKEASFSADFESIDESPPLRLLNPIAGVDREVVDDDFFP